MPSAKSSKSTRKTGVQPPRPGSSADNPPPTKKMKTDRPLMSIARPPKFDLGSNQPPTQAKETKSKGKERQVVTANAPCNVEDVILWIDKYEPLTEEDLAVHKRKVQDVRQWLTEAFDGGPSGKLKKYRRILVLTGPAGTAKTATIRVLSTELGYEILEWRNSMDDHFSREPDHSPSGWASTEYEGLSDKFQAFLTRASSCRPIFTSQSSAQSASQASRSSQLTPSRSSSVVAPHASPLRRQLIVLEDLPNVLHPATQASFHAALEAFVASPENAVSPLVIIVSDAGLRGEVGEDDGTRWKSRSKEAMDIRNILSNSLLTSPYVTQISFNPIAVTYMRTALKAMLDRHFASSKSGARPTKDVLDVIVQSSNGDIRSAVMALQFACTADAAHGKPVKGSRRGAKGQGPSARVMLEAVTRREQSLALFHLLGKIMYNKRKGDPPSSFAAAKDIRRDQEIDAGLKDPPPLPSHLKEHERRPSRVDIESLYADTPIDASLLSLYVHQNYTQYCSTLDECDALMDSLSWVDSSGGETWYAANPHQFHLVALGTLHALPSPVPRRAQKPFKPVFFDALRRLHGAEDGVRDVQAWLQQEAELALPGWGQREVALELGTVLRAREAIGRTPRAPLTHRMFSTLEFARDVGGPAELVEEGDVVQDEPAVERNVRPLRPAVQDEQEITGAWLSDDDIEEW
ncbi:Rad17-domain-containing protein [Trametes elegans]|nr:Rad17-domain-containing protein [Trametes elegans]